MFPRKRSPSERETKHTNFPNNVLKDNETEKLKKKITAEQ